MKKAALITGASGGIGFSIAEKLANEGYSLYLHFNKNTQAADKLKVRLGDKKSSVKWVQADLSLLDGVSSLLDQINEEIDVIIHNSGKSHFGLITDICTEQVQEMVQLHVTSPFLITKALLPKMIENKRGNIVVISSIWGLTGASCEVLYSTVKGAQNTFVKALAKEVAPSGIRVNGIAPGAIDTNMLNDFSREEIVQLSNEIPLGRIGVPHEIAEAVAFLISSRSSYITGQILSVNGGLYC